MKRIVTFFKSLWHRKTLKAAAALTGKKVSPDDLNADMKVAVRIFKQKDLMVQKYRALMGHTDQLLRNSMVVSYEKALMDVLTFLVPEAKKELKAQKKQVAPRKQLSV